MQTLARTVQTILSKWSVPIVQTAGLKTFATPIKFGEIDFPERRKLRVMEKVPQFPPGMRAPKMQKRLRYMRGPEPVHTFLVHRQYGIIATKGGRLKHGHFEMMRLTLGRKINQETMFAVWRVDPPWQPVTKKSQGQRMGGGKGPIDHYVTPVKAGRVILEVAGHCEFFEVKKILTQIANQLPFEAEAISQEILDQKAAEEKYLEENNQHLWTWKYMIQNNMLGCHKWISPFDKYWFNKHL